MRYYRDVFLQYFYARKNNVINSLKNPTVYIIFVLNRISIIDMSIPEWTVLSYLFCRYKLTDYG